jgi:hypothetical protein
MKHLHIISLLSLCLLAACATTQAPKQQVDTEPSPVQPNETVSNSGMTLLRAVTTQLTPALLACEEYRVLESDAQKKQYSETLQTLTKNKQDLVHRFKLACMYALPSSYIKDYAKAHIQLQQLREDQTLTEMDKAYINQLYTFNIENLKQLQRLRDESKSLSNLHEKHEALQKKYDETEKKLLRLKNIEKKLNVR